jgi:hypothetical protein
MMKVWKGYQGKEGVVELEKYKDYRRFAMKLLVFLQLYNSFLPLIPLPYLHHGVCT